MILSPFERRFLETVAKRQLVTKNEMKELLKTDGSVLDTAASSLISRKLVSAVNPVGSTCYAITQQGTRLLEQLSD
ncbi:MAG: hypothetical protein HY368_02200 [Candidatus Aenigmarchaeota archaeon]|nr:hypothetical protein [Candidatus Aenigmarchaeota archaeon]